MALDFAQVANGKPKATKEKKERAVVMLTPTAPQVGPFQKELEKHKSQLAELEKQANELKVTDQRTLQVSIDGAGIAKGLIKTIEGRRAEVTTPFREYINKVNNAAKFFTDPLKRIAETFSLKSGDYQYQLDIARKKQEKAIEEANRKLQADLNKQAEKDGVEAPTVTPIKPAKPETVIHTEGGHSQHLRKEWKGEIEEPAMLLNMIKLFKFDIQDGKIAIKSKMLTRIDEILSLADYYIMDQKLINQAVRMGVREIPGVKIFEKVSAVHR